MNPEDEKEPEDDIESDKYKMIENEIILELNIVKLLDSIANVPLLVQNQQKALLEFKDRVVDPYIQLNPDFAKEWTEIGREVDSIFSITQRAIDENNLQNFFGRPKLFVNILIMLAFLVPMFLITILLPDLSLYIMFAIIPAYCFVQMYRNKKQQEKFTYVMSQLNPLIDEKISEYRDNLLPKIQDLIDNASRNMNENNISPEKFKMYLFNNKYENIEILGESNVKGMIYYIIKLT
ncbi:MAG: hypothetical protein EAX96_12160 [Candidatus Lokiarchaeota archaeon]|nr:hypothetical protein [Candidatus Lokiarchaeota archaeon]